MPKKTALFIGRFQPLHRGHVHAIRQAMKKYNVVIAVGSINKKGKDNPFSYSQRRRMLEAEFPGVKIIGVKDTTDRRWAKKIKKLRFDAVISGNQRVWKCLKGCRIEQPDFFHPGKYSGTGIRKMLNEGKSIDKFVPKEAVRAVKTRKTKNS